MKARLARSIFLLIVAVLLDMMAPRPGLAAATPRYVSPAGADSGACNNPAAPCKTVQYAIDQAVSGDEIRLAGGTFTGVYGVAWITDKSLTLKGGYAADFGSRDPAANPSTLDGNNSGTVIDASGQTDARIDLTLDGLRVINGSVYDADTAGGLKAAHVNLTVENCLFQNNRVNIGPNGAGAIFLLDSHAVIRNSQFINNVGYQGGAIHHFGSYIQRFSVTLENNLFQGNQAGLGGGIYMRSVDLTLTGNTFQSNTATGAGSEYKAYLTGGAFVIEDAQFLVQRNLFLGNTATQGSGGGGAILEAGLGDPAGVQRLENNVLVGNTLGNAARTGAGLLIFDLEDAEAHYNTFSANTGGDGSGLSVMDGSSVTLANNLVAHQAVGLWVEAGSTLTADRILWYNNTANTGGGGSITLNNPYTGDPNFDADGYHLLAGSAALGRAAGVLLPEDVDGDVRPQGAAPDLGADELRDVGLRVTKQANAPAFYPSSSYIYTIEVLNDGVNQATNLALSDDLPPELRATAVSVSVGSCTLNTAWGGVTTCSVGTLAAGAGAQMQLTVETTGSLSGAALLHNTATATASETQNSASLDTPFHTCLARLNNDPTTYYSVQDAIAASASASDVAKISGVCTGVSERLGLRQLAYVDRSLALQGGWNSDFSAHDIALYPTTLDALGGGRVIYASEGITLTLEGLTLTGGDASGLGGAGKGFDEGVGGGIYAQYNTVALQEVVVSDNYASTTAGYGWGGGIAIYNGALTVNASTLEDNTASLNSNGAGGGLALWQTEQGASRSYAVVIRDSFIRDNRGSAAAHGRGGGLQMNYGYRDGVTIANTELSGNQATSGSGEGKGGAVDCLQASNRAYLAIQNSQIMNNQATGSAGDNGFGGGVYTSGCNLRLTDNTVQNNIAANTADSDYAGYGGGFYINGGQPAGGGAEFVARNRVTNNTANAAGDGFGGGIYLGATGASTLGQAERPANGTLNGDLLRYNTAGASGYDTRGGGLYVGPPFGGAFIGSINPTLNNLVVADNGGAAQGAGIYLVGAKPTARFTTILNHATIARNSGGDGAGARVAELVVGSTTYTSTLQMHNSIIAGQATGVQVNAGSRATLDTNLWYNNTQDTGGGGTIVNTNAINSDPLFDADGYHLTGTSPARDYLADTGPDGDTDGQFRYMGHGWELGADEYPGPGFQLSKTPHVTSAAPGESVIYTIRITNRGVLAATGTTLVDDLPAASRALSVQTTLGTCSAPGGWGHDVSCNLGDMAPTVGAIITVTAQVTTTQPANPPLALVNTVTASATGEDGGTRRSASATVLVSDCWARTGGTVYGNVQQAIDAAEASGVVQVSGACYGVTTIGELRQVASFTGKSLTLEGGWNRTFSVQDAALYPTILDAQGQGRVVYIKDTEAVTLTHLILQHGSALGLGGVKDMSNFWDAGAGLFADNTNVADDGGRLVVQHCTLRENGVAARSYGGGAYVYRTYNGVVFEDTLFQDNGYYAASGSSSATPPNIGGGLYVGLCGGVMLCNSRFVGNDSGYDGGLAFSMGSSYGWNTLLENLVFDGNRAYGNGGAAALNGGTEGDVTLRNVAVVNNQCGAGASNTPGLYYDAEMPLNAFDHVTASNNTGGNGNGLRFAGAPYPGPTALTLRNLVVANQAVGVYIGPQINATLDGVLWHNNTDDTYLEGTSTLVVNNALTGNPLFAADGYHLTGPSPALDAAASVDVTGDVDGEIRPTSDPLDPPDLGADEHKALTVNRLTAGTMTFGAVRARVTFHGSIPSGLENITIQTIPGRFPTGNPADEVVSRTVVITPSTEVSFDAALSLGYRDDEVHGLPEADLRLYRWTGSAWYGYVGTVDADNNFVTAAHAHNFSRWLIGTSNAPTAVEIASFRARAELGAIRLTWETASEVSLLGFYLYRAESPDAPPARLNNTLIPTQAPGGATSASYAFADEAVAPGVIYWYWLEAVDTQGAPTRYGPASAMVASGWYRIWLPLVSR